MAPEITIAIPVFNGARFVEATLRSILAQTISTFKLIVFDDASEDDSVRLVTEVAADRALVVRSFHRLGITANWNRALASASTGYLVIAHQDDLYEPGYLESMATLLDQSPNAFMAHCRASAIDREGSNLDSTAERYKDRFWPDSDPFEREPEQEIDILRRGNYVMCPSVMLRVDATRRIGVFNERYQFVADWDYWLRGLDSGFTMTGTRQRLLKYRRHPDNATRQAERSLVRFEEELTLLERLATTRKTADPFVAARNSLLVAFVQRLSSDGTVSARELLAFGRSRIPGFKWTTANALMTATLPFGRTSGRILEFAEKLWARVEGKRRHA